MTIIDRVISRLSRRAPDIVIGGPDNPYLRRWWLIPRNRYLNVYLHEFLRSDDDRALHDHPWVNLSVLLRGVYWEWRETGIPDLVVCDTYGPGDWVFRRSGRIAHRIEVDQPCWTLFITGPRYREWGFHCPKGWVHWTKFTAADDPGQIGQGCVE
jgi:hypothetical protein